MPKIAYFIFFMVFSTSVFAVLDLSATINCTYQKGQALSKNESENLYNSKPLKWTFNGLASKNPIFVSGGDTGKVLPVSIDNGVVIYLPSLMGTSTFVVWNSGESFWSKQSNMMGEVYSQQFIGNCVN